MFVCLLEIELGEIVVYMFDVCVVEYMLLLIFEWDVVVVVKFVVQKEVCWVCDGLGYWVFLVDGYYVGWGGFQKEGDEWDYGLVLWLDVFGFGVYILKKVLVFVVVDVCILFVIFFLLLLCKNLGVFKWFGVIFVGEIEYDGVIFLKFRLEMQ